MNLLSEFVAIEIRSFYSFFGRRSDFVKNDTGLILVRRMDVLFTTDFLFVLIC